jgi:transcriptional regulator with XRE-family HTH domain
MDYGKALRVSRAIAGLEQRQLATSAGLNPSHISLIEKGKRKPSVRAIGKLCRALHIPEPLFNMLAAEAADLKGVEAEEFQQIGTYLARFLIRSDRSTKFGGSSGGKRKPRHQLDEAP